jgi:IS1 family transposase/transposase-like protein
VVCHDCQAVAQRYGRSKQGRQRYHCLTCRKTFIEPQERLLGEMRVPVDRALQCLRLLLEGMSVRSTERLTGVHHTTILSLLVLAGGRCERLLRRRIRRLKVADVQADEIWGFVWCKEKTRHRLGLPDAASVGDAYCFVAIERKTKLVLAWHLGHRTTEDTEAFMEKLRRATEKEFQLTTDGWPSYPDAVSLSLGTRVRYAQLIKTYQAAHPQQSPEGERRYSPSKVLEVVKVPLIGEPDPARICTSHVERQNLTMRMHIRRLTRLTNAFSKKWENLRAALALHFAYYNFCRTHRMIRCTPAMAAGVTNHIWEIEELLGS